MNLKDIDLLSKMTNLEVAIVTRLLKEADEKMAKVFEGQENDENNLTWQEATCIYLYTDEIFHQKLSKWKSSEIDIVNSKYWQEYECILINAINKCRQNIGKNGKIFYCGLHGLQMNFANSNKNVENKRSNGIISKQDMLSKEFVSFSKSFAVAASFCGDNGIIFGIDNSNNSFNGADISKYSKYGTECEFLITRLQFECNRDRIEFVLAKESAKHQFITIVSRSDDCDNDKNVFEKEKNVFMDNESARKFILSSEQGSSIGEMKELKMITSQQGELDRSEDANKANINSIGMAPNGESGNNDNNNDMDGSECSDDTEGANNSKSYKYDLLLQTKRRRRRRKNINVIDNGCAYGDSFMIKVERMKMSELEKQATLWYKRRMEFQECDMIIVPNNDDSLKDNGNVLLDKGRVYNKNNNISNMGNNTNNNNNNNSFEWCALPLVYDINICMNILKTFCNLYDSSNIVERRKKVSRLVSSWKHCNNDTRRHLTYFLKQFRYLLKINKNKYGWDKAKLMNENREINIKNEINKRLRNKYKSNYFYDYNEYDYYYDNSNNDNKKYIFLFNNKFVDTRLIDAIWCMINDYIHKYKCATAHTLTNLKRCSKLECKTNKMIKMKIETSPIAGSVNDENFAALRAKKVTTNEGQAREKSEKRKKIIEEIEAVVVSHIANAPQIFTPNGLESAIGSANGQDELVFGLFDRLCNEAGV